ncbi:hypothetical protein ACIVBQ_000558 [Tenacibaculum discolor]
MKNQYHLEKAMLAIFAILTFNSERLSAQFQKSLESKKIRVVNSTHILRKQITPGQGTRQLVDSNTVRVDGKSDFDKNKLNDDEVLIIQRIRVGYDKHATDSGLETQLLYNKAVPASFRNASFRVRQGGSVLYEMPMSDLVNRYTGNSIEDDYVDLANPIVLVGGTEFDFELVFPEGATPDTVEYLEYAFTGQKAIRSTAA